jgi:hypothetical protein
MPGKVPGGAGCSPFPTNFASEETQVTQRDTPFVEQWLPTTTWHGGRDQA